MQARSDWIAATVALVILATAAVVAAMIASAPAANQPTAGTTPPSEAQVTPVSPQLALARRLGDVVVGVRARAGGPVDVSTIPPDLGRIDSAAVRVTVGSRTAVTSSCGWNCVRVPAPTAMQGKVVMLGVEVEHRRAGGRASIALPGRLPPAGAALVRRATRATAAARRVRVDELLSSGRAGIRTRLEYAPPGRMSYSSSNGAKGVVIGRRRWDYAFGRWTPAPAERVPQPTDMWSGARFARWLGTAKRDGRRVDVVSAFRPDPRYPAWFRLYVGTGDRVVAAEMIAPAHFMLERFTRYGGAVVIEAPE